MDSKTPIISLQSVTKRFGKFAAVDDVSFDVGAGEVVGFVGVNGAGKTTTIHMLLSFTSPSKGSISVFNHTVTSANAHMSHRHIGYAAGDMELPSHLTGRQYMEFVLSQSKGDHEKKYSELIKLLKPQLDKKISTLSRGNKQKIALLAVFVASPELVILDEPTSGLDPIMQETFLALVRAEQQKGVTIFMSSHYLQEVAEVCSRVILMKSGRIVEDLSADQLRHISGKVVRVTTNKKVPAPTSHTKHVSYTENGENVEMEFSYDGPTSELQKWIGAAEGLGDISISERTLEAEFRNLYADEESK